MRHEPIVAKVNRSTPLSALLIAVACLGTFLYIASRPLIPDIAWLIEASRRWREGAELYRDIIEVNPPLIFYETVALSGGVLTGPAYMAGVCIVICASALWVLRMRGTYFAMAALAAMLVGGITDFGQRDHLALIFVIPFLLGDGASRNERIALGLWAFLGIGLKPYLLPIPLAAIGTRAVLAHSWRPLVSAEMITLAAGCVAYLGVAVILHPAYFDEIIPIGQYSYFAYGSPLLNYTFPHAFIVVGLAIAAALDRRHLPLTAAMMAAVGSYYLQGRNWSYHFVPAAGLIILQSILLRSRAGYCLAILACGYQLWRGPHQPRLGAPIETDTYAVLSAHVFAAYPSCGRNVMRYPALWTIPGAWQKLPEPKAAGILDRERRIIRGDILRARPQAIYADAREHKPYFGTQPFDWMQFLGPFRDYRYVATVQVAETFAYDVWQRRDIATSNNLAMTRTRNAGCEKSVGT